MANGSTSGPAGLTGRCFVHPVFDYLLIGGGLSLIVIPAVYLFGGPPVMADFAILPWFILLSNSAHFAASTVRLYTKPGSRETLPFLTMAFPIVTLGVLTLCIFEAEVVGRYVQLIYLSWSPYHYAAQAYGLAVMYCVRSGCELSSSQKKFLWWIALLPFLKVLLTGTSKHLASWHLPESLMWGDTDWRAWVNASTQILGVLAMALPLVLFGIIWRKNRGIAPLISLLVILTNGVWFVVFPLIDGFVWTTIFHGIQYLAIVMIFHVRDRMADSDNSHGVVYHVAWFYGMCVILGYALFNCLPFGYQLLGFGVAESVLLVIAAINIHHFIVDGYIWKLGRGDANRRVVDTAVIEPAIVASDA
ncbi:MAG: hypothetical protein RIK87_28010 [Fuerstiella sp.]